MSLPDWKTASEKDVWAYFATQVADTGAEVLLMGETIASMYLEKVYRFDGMDFHTEFGTEVGVFKDIMKAMGFEQNKQGGYEHPTYWKLRFKICPPPASFSKQDKESKIEGSTPGELIKIYCPTDAVKERLNMAIHLNAFEYVTHASKIAKAHPIDLAQVKTFCEKQAAMDMFNFFLKKANLQKK
ncbi:MAG: hypothetical protein HOO06_06510 [Bdellovibrionaceae bacterium]|nr:hypothetical protein [Pseudobdellovibrionaceae bacterium]